MRFTGTMMMLAALMLVGTTAMAQTCPPAVTVPAPVVEPATPAAPGAGPGADLTTLTGAEFDREYIRTMYQLNTEVIAYTSQGIALTTDSNLRSLSIKIRDEQTDRNAKLALWHRNMGLGRIPVNYTSVNNMVAALPAAPGADFDVAYAQGLLSLLRQQNQIANIATSRASMPELSEQVRIAREATTKEIEALQRWLDERGVVAVPATTPGAGPMVSPDPNCPATPTN